MREKFKIILALSIFGAIMINVNWLKAQLADSPWPMYQHDAQHTGRSQYVGPSNPNLAYLFMCDGIHSPVIGQNNIIYIYVNNNVYALYPDGTPKWKYSLGDYIEASGMVISNDGTIYFATDRYGTTPEEPAFHALNPDGSVKWLFQDIKNGTAPAIGSDGTIYICSYPETTAKCRACFSFFCK